MPEECPLCGGEIEVEFIGNRREKRCKKCSRIIDDDVFTETMIKNDKQYEVME